MTSRVGTSSRDENLEFVGFRRYCFSTSFTDLLSWMGACCALHILFILFPPFTNLNPICQLFSFFPAFTISRERWCDIHRCIPVWKCFCTEAGVAYGGLYSPCLIGLARCVQFVVLIIPIPCPASPTSVDLSIRLVTDLPSHFLGSGGVVRHHNIFVLILFVLVVVLLFVLVGVQEGNECWCLCFSLVPPGMLVSNVKKRFHAFFQEGDARELPNDFKPSIVPEFFTFVFYFNITLMYYREGGG